MQKKKGTIELSLNFIVIVVISIAVLILSFAFVRKIYTGATSTQETYYKQFEDQMESLACDSLDRVCIGKNTKTIGNGVAVFTMRIVNANNINQFTISKALIQTSCKKASDLSGCAGSFTASLAEQYSIPNNEAQSLVIAISKTGAAQSGTYIFDVDVKGDAAAYGKEKLYVVVP